MPCSMWCASLGAERSYIECKYEPDSKFAVAAVAAVAVAAAVIVVVAVAAAAADLKGPHYDRGRKESFEKLYKGHHSPLPQSCC